MADEAQQLPAAGAPDARCGAHHRAIVLASTRHCCTPVCLCSLLPRGCRQEVWHPWRRHAESVCGSCPVHVCVRACERLHCPVHGFEGLLRGWGELPLVKATMYSYSVLLLVVFGLQCYAGVQSVSHRGCSTPAVVLHVWWSLEGKNYKLGWWWAMRDCGCVRVLFLCRL